MALTRLAEAVMQRYTDAKVRRAALDFADLIEKTCVLLATAASAEWVLYKLDNGLDHILVDESQDTSPDQWDVVAALAGEFFSGSGAREEAAHGLCRRRREAVDLLLPGCSARDVRQDGRRASRR